MFVQEVFCRLTRKKVQNGFAFQFIWFRSSSPPPQSFMKGRYSYCGFDLMGLILSFISPVICMACHIFFKKKAEKKKIIVLWLSLQDRWEICIDISGFQRGCLEPKSQVSLNNGEPEHSGHFLAQLNVAFVEYLHNFLLYVPLDQLQAFVQILHQLLSALVIENLPV